MLRNLINCGAQFWPNDDGDKDFCTVAGKVGDDSGGEGGFESEVHLESQPAGSEQVAHSGSKEQSEEGGRDISGKVVNKETGNERQEDIAD